LSFDTATLQPESPPNLNALDEELLEEEGSATLSHSLSTHSFMSAMSETEDFGMVNLHMQVEKCLFSEISKRFLISFGT